MILLVNIWIGRGRGHLSQPFLLFFPLRLPNPLLLFFLQFCLQFLQISWLNLAITPSLKFVLLPVFVPMLHQPVIFASLGEVEYIFDWDFNLNLLRRHQDRYQMVCRGRQ